MRDKEKRHTPSFLHSRLTSIMSVSMVLFLLGVVSMMGLIGKELRDFVRESMSFTVILSPEAGESEVSDMRKRIERQPFVKEIVYHSKEEALEEVSRELGENPETFLGWNPLSPSFEVKVKSEYTSVADSVAMVEAALKKLPSVRGVSYKRDLLDSLNKNIKVISAVVIFIAVLLLLISFALINNTIRLLIYSRRFSIYTMRLVGATPAFIRRPFIAQNILGGLIAALIALAVLAWGWYYVSEHYPLMAAVLTHENALIVAGIVILLGILISLVSAVMAVNKYMRMDINKLYRV